MYLRGAGSKQQPARRIQGGHEIQVYRAGVCKRDHRTCVTDLDCPPNVPCVTGKSGRILAASPDSDNDGVPDHLDNCPDTPNPDQTSDHAMLERLGLRPQPSFAQPQPQAAAQG